MQELNFEQVEVVSGGFQGLNGPEDLFPGMSGGMYWAQDSSGGEGGAGEKPWITKGSGDFTCCDLLIGQLDVGTLHLGNILNSFFKSAAEWAQEYNEKVVNNGSDHVGR